MSAVPLPTTPIRFILRQFTLFATVQNFGAFVRTGQQCEIDFTIQASILAGEEETRNGIFHAAMIAITLYNSGASGAADWLIFGADW
ncbi:MAG: hypothetical protein ACRD5R_11855 [Candidatus Acidiferrales bacterium]